MVTRGKLLITAGLVLVLIPSLYDLLVNDNLILGSVGVGVIFLATGLINLIKADWR